MPYSALPNHENLAPILMAERSESALQFASASITLDKIEYVPAIKDCEYSRYYDS